MTAAPQSPLKISESSSSLESSVLFRIEGKAGVITLNRPKALNALDLEMIRQIRQTLLQWRTDPKIEFIVVEGVGEKAFCAGGDIRSVYEARLRDDWAYMEDIFREEYEMNYVIGTYPKPYISLIQGYCMGGGMGLSIHGSHRIVTDDTVMAMPEAGIGFFTDVGASYFLNQCPGKIGIFMGITGEKIKAEDCLYTGLGTHYVPQDQWSSLKKNILSAAKVSEALAVINSFHKMPPKSAKGEGLEHHRELIDTIFSAQSMEEINERLEKNQTPQGSAWLKKIDTQSPLSMKVILALLQKTKETSLKKCLMTEFRVGQHFMGKYDFFEGVRALLIDKDNRPQWQPRQFRDILVKDVKKYFSPLVGKENLKL